jgi:hypothetical protein
MIIEKVEYAGWQHCLRLSDGRIEAVLTTDVGPRIIRFGAVGGRNLLYENPGQLGLRGGDEWRAYGGHRLWHAPEIKPRTYAPDNGPVPFAILEHGVCLSLAAEPSTGIAKQMELQLTPYGDGLTVIHRLTNHNPWAVDLAPWAITQMAPGGTVVMPQEPYAPHPDVRDPLDTSETPGSYLPVRSFNLWPFTRLDDPRWLFLERFILTRQDCAIRAPLKYGVSNHVGWVAYVLDGEMLLKRFAWQEGGSYPDLGSNAEIWVDGDLVEVETLGPLATLQPGSTTEHRETWSLVQQVPVPTDSQKLHGVFQALLKGVVA